MSIVSVKPREKIYYNINITSNPRPGEFVSEAKFHTLLNQTLIDDVSQYQFLLHKFKIDTESIPLFHVDLQQPQPPVINNTNFITNYHVYLVDSSFTVHSTSLYYSKPFMPPARIVKSDGGLVFYDNRDYVFAVYSYDFFIEMINSALIELFGIASITSPVPFFVYDHTIEKICLYTYKNDTNQIFFSKNLFPYIGEAFETIWYEKKPNFLLGVNEAVYSITVRENPFNIITYSGNDYIKMVQEYQAMSSWASINRILFVSNRLPIRREYYPIANSTGIMNENNFSYENLVTRNIISSFIFPSSTAGDFRTNIVYTTATIDTADLIDMSPSGSIREIDIEVLWSDKYGNVFPVLLGSNKQVNIRLAFVKK